MIGWLLRHLRLARNALAPAESPRPLAWGFALGVVLGLVPKGNLVAAALAIALLATRVNLGVGLLAAAAFSWVGLLLDPLAHRLGAALLGAGFLRPLWSALYALPLAPWTRLNNTVVLGQTILGALALYPAYRLSLPLFARWCAWRRGPQAEPARSPRPEPAEATEGRPVRPHGAASAPRRWRIDSPDVARPSGRAEPAPSSPADVVVPSFGPAGRRPARGGPSEPPNAHR